MLYGTLESTLKCMIIYIYACKYICAYVCVYACKRTQVLAVSPNQLTSCDDTFCMSSCELNCCETPPTMVTEANDFPIFDNDEKSQIYKHKCAYVHVFTPTRGGIL